jgi:hypothetical protein
LGTAGVVGGKVLAGDSEENVVIDPFRQGADSVAPENICAGIGDCSVYTSGRGQAEVIADVDRKLVLPL